MPRIESQLTDSLGYILERREPISVKQIEIVDYDFSNSKIPNSFDGITIVQFSDNHNTNPFENHSDLARELKQKHPDIVVISGDLINNEKFQNSIDFVDKLGEIVGYNNIYYSTGNHEFKNLHNEKSTLPQVISLLKQRGVNVLRNEFKEITHQDGSIFIMGIDDPASFTYNNSKKSPDEIEYTGYIVNYKLSKIPSDKLVILISHRPEKIDQYQGADLVFSGHTHGGQIRLLKHGIIAPHQGLIPKYTKGLYVKNNTTMIVSPGLAENMRFPVKRFNNPGGINIIHLRQTV